MSRRSAQGIVRPDHPRAHPADPLGFENLAPDWYPIPSVGKVDRATRIVRWSPTWNEWIWFPTVGKGAPAVLVPLPSLARLTPLPD